LSPPGRSAGVLPSGIIGGFEMANVNFLQVRDPFF